MKTIDVDEELYRYIASHTQHIGENASDILRRMLAFTAEQTVSAGLPVATVAAVTDKKLAARPRDRARALRELLLSEKYTQQRKAVNRFMLVLSTLYMLNASEFAAATESLYGRTRTYFAGDQQMLLKHGVNTKPKHVPGTPYWVITNTNTDRKRSMVEHIMSTMDFPSDLTEKVCASIK